MTLKSQLFCAISLSFYAGSLAAQGVQSGNSFTDGVAISDTNTFSADLFVAGDTVLDEAVCIGEACTEGEAFADSTLLKLNYTQIRLQARDTSNGDYPSTDWTLRFNDTERYGLDRFSIEDSTFNTIPFSVMSAAPDNSMWISQVGYVGLGTMLPQMPLHVVDDNSATVRLETTGASPRIWDMITSASGFFLKDTTAGTFPFFVSANAPFYALNVNPTGLVGLGTSLPQAGLHMMRNDGTARILVQENSGQKAVREMFKMENNGGSYFTLANTDTGNEWYFVHENNTQGRFMINHSDGGLQMALTRDGNLTILGSLFTASECSAGCDRVFDEDYPLPTIPEQAAMMRERKHLPNVGPTPEDGPFNITKMTGGMLNELEKAHLYIAELEERDRMRAAENQALIAQNADIEARLAALEAMIAKH
ncbi:hypothetical protein [Pacificoceanicola onchidii]|uniref:hypothetical protein n=1 Tax=Pacificoceanicola onchidii TaxID=2562685 RepID=UPI0010A32774|nr:hypothetical protein [Pacificoceanicola onchidii]